MERRGCNVLKVAGSRFARAQCSTSSSSSSSRSDAVYRATVDSSSGVLWPFFDADTRLVFLAGRGDANIRFYELDAGGTLVHYVGQYLSSEPQRALALMPKRGLRLLRCEIARFYKLHATNSLCEPVAIICPRRNDTIFQEVCISHIPGTIQYSIGHTNVIYKPERKQDVYYHVFHTDISESLFSFCVREYRKQY